jgi:hypothetical protein
MPGFTLTLRRRGTMLAVLTATLALALIAVTLAEAPGASMRILWRYAVLSFDNPATQMFDEMASASSEPTDPGAAAGTLARLPLASRLTPSPEPIGFGTAALSSRFTRSPPAA